MVKINVTAVYRPNRRNFMVSIKFGKKNVKEVLTISQFLKRYLKQPEPVLRVAGLEIKIEGDENGECEKTIRDYLKKVAQSYLDSRPATN